MSDPARPSRRSVVTGLAAIGAGALVMAPGGGNPPIVTTGAATGVTPTGATLNGTVNPRKRATTARFEWGLTTGYGNTTPDVSVGSGNVAVPISATLTSLQSGTTYHYRARATNSAGTTFGLDATFVTQLPPPPGGTPWLPFDMPERAVLAAAARKVWVHWFPPFPISFDNDPIEGGGLLSPEYWEAKKLPPGAIEGSTDHRPYGGQVRDRKIYRDPLPEPGYEVADLVTEVNQAIAAGYDGFLADILQVSPNQQWGRLLWMIQAANTVADPYFRLVLRPNGETSDSADAAVLADNLAGIADEPCIYWHNDGGTLKLMLAPFAPEQAPAGAGSGGAAAVQFWTDVATRLQTVYSIPSLLWPCYVSSWTLSPQAPSFDPISYGHARWGDRDPLTIDNESNNNRLAPSYCHTTFAKPWMHWAAPQDMRPATARGQKYYEAGGADALRECWRAAIDGNADVVQELTWDDYSESTQVSPSRDSGWAWQDLMSYYRVWFKMEAPPPIVRDAVYLIHRKQPVSGVTYNGYVIPDAERRFMTLNGGTPARDEIDATVFLTAPADVEILVDGVVQGGPQPCPAGVTAVKRPLVSGTVSARIIRGGNTVASVISPHVVSTTQPVEDLLYRAKSSLRP